MRGARMHHVEWARQRCSLIKNRKRISLTMFRPLQLFIGLRYTRAKRRNHFISFISAVSMLGIAVGVMALIAVMSVMNGFQGDLQDRILGMVSHATIQSVGDSIADWQDTLTKAQADPHVLGAAPYIESQVLMQGRRRSGAVIRGVLPEMEPKVSNIADKMGKGHLADLKPGAYGIVLGNELARSAATKSPSKPRKSM